MSESTQPEPENPEVKEGDVTENPTEPEEDASNPHIDEDETLTSEGTDAEVPYAPNNPGKPSDSEDAFGDPHSAPGDPANIADAHPTNQPEAD